MCSHLQLSHFVPWKHRTTPCWNWIPLALHHMCRFLLSVICYLKKTVPFSANDPFAVKKSSQRKWSTSRRARARRDDREMNKMRGWSQINSLLSNSLSWMQTTNAGQSMAERTHARAHACRHKYTHTHNHKQIGRTAPTVIDRLKRHQCV